MQTVIFPLHQQQRQNSLDNANGYNQSALWLCNEEEEEEGGSSDLGWSDM